MRIHIAGVALFAFIPLVLWLYLAQPLGPGPSVVAGLVLMFGHRFVAAPWMSRHATERCLWCGSRSSAAVVFEILSGRRRVAAAACGAPHRAAAERFLTFVGRFRLPIAAGIFLPLALLLAESLANAAGRPFLAHATSRGVFRLVVALTVVSVSLLWPVQGRADAPPRSPFPLHNLFLLGIRATLWVFRVVGAVWLAIEVPPLIRAISGG